MSEIRAEIDAKLIALRKCYRALDGVIDLHKSGDSEGDFTISGSKIQAHFKYSADDLGICDGKLIHYVMTLVKATKVASAQVPLYADESYACTPAQLGHLHRALEYATPSNNAFQGSLTNRQDIPISELLSIALQAFEFDYEQAWSGNEFCSIAEYANLLRVLSRETINRRELKTLTVLSNRTLKTILRDMQGMGWLTEEKYGTKRGNYLVSLTSRGEFLKTKCLETILAVEQTWISRYGSHTTKQLKELLAGMVRLQELEYPHHLTGYGPMDPALTGGDYHDEKEGTPFIPRRGAEWPVVKKTGGQEEPSPTIPSLISRVLMDFDIQYVRLNLDNLLFTSTVLTKIKDAGTPLAEVQQCLSGVATSLSGNGRSYLERHLYVVVDEDKSSASERLVHPTSKARNSRDRYVAAVAHIEQQWEDLFGNQIIQTLRDTLVAVASDRSERFLEFPDPCQWIWNLRQRNWTAKALSEKEHQDG